MKNSKKKEPREDEATRREEPTNEGWRRSEEEVEPMEEEDGHRTDQVNPETQVLNTRVPHGFIFTIDCHHMQLKTKRLEFYFWTLVLESRDASLLHSFAKMTTN